MWTLALAAFQGISQASSDYSSYKLQEIQAKTSAHAARLQGKSDILELQSQYNKAMASDAVIAAAQGRSGPSVEGIARAAQAKFNWDSDFTNLSAKMRESGYQDEAKIYKTAKRAAAGQALFGAGMDYGKSLYSIGGSTQKDNDNKGK